MFLNISEKKIKYFLICVFGLLFSLQVYYYIPRINSLSEITRTDFASYYVGGKVFLQDHTRLYDLQLQEQIYSDTTHIDIQKYNELTNFRHEKLIEELNLSSYFLPFRALPLMSLFFAPFAALGYSEAYYAFLGLNVFIVGFLVYASLELFDIRVSKPNILLATLAIYSFPPVWITFAQGQTSLLLLFFLFLSLYFWKSKQYFWAGVFISFLCIKVQFFVLLLPLFLLVKSRKNYLFGFSLASAFLLVLNSILYGKFFINDYLGFLSMTESVGFFSSINNMMSIQALFANLGNVSRFTQFSLYLSIGFYILYLIRLVAIKLMYEVSLEIEFLSINLLIALYFGLHLFVQDLVVGILPLVFVIFHLLENTKLKDAAIYVSDFAKFGLLFLLFLYLLSLVGIVAPILSSFVYLFMVLVSLPFSTRFSYERYKKDFRTKK